MKNVFLLFLSFLFSAPAFAQNERAERAFAELPEACQAIVHSYSDDIVLQEVEFEREGGADVYEVEFLADGVPTELEITSDGEIVKVEQIVRYEDLPEALKQAIDWSPDSKRRIKITKTTRIIYEVQIEGQRGHQSYNALGKQRGHSGHSREEEDEKDD